MNLQRTDNAKKFATLFVASIATIASSAGPSEGAVANYTYDNLGRVLTETYANGKRTTYAYDLLGHRTQVSVTTVTNHAPTSVNDSLTVFSGSTGSLNPRSNDTDADGDPLMITAKTDGAHGTVVINSGASVTYTPASGYAGPDSFTYTIADGLGGTATGTVSVTVNYADGTQLFAQSSGGAFSYTVPVGVSYVDIEGWGAGGPGWYYPGLYPYVDPIYRGGNGGGYFKKHISVTSSQVIDGSVDYGNNTGSTYVNSPALVANSGFNGSTASGGDVNISGTTGGESWDSSYGYGGGAGNGGGNVATGNGSSPGGGGAFNGLGVDGQIKITARSS